jgi:hypothetical protein
MTRGIPANPMPEEAETSRCKDVGRQAMHTARASVVHEIFIAADIDKLPMKNKACSAMILDGAGGAVNHRCK